MSEATRTDAIVVGAGISGLTAGFYLSRAGLETVVLEASGRTGGAIETLRVGKWVFERGPNTVLGKPPVQHLLADAELGERVIEAHPAAKRRYLWKGDRLLPLPGGPVGLVRTPLFSWRAKLRLLAEPFVGRAPAEREETIAELVRRRLGGELLDYAVGPFVSGVYAGDPERLSVRWAVPRIHALEVEHGSLIRGALARRKGPVPGGTMTSCQTGLEELPDRLVAAIGTRGVVETATPCRRIARDSGDFVVETEAETHRARRLLTAVPAPALSELLSGISGGAATPFAEIRYAPVVVCSFGFRREDIAHPLDGFGFLAPRKESLRILGCLFPSSVFPGRAPEGHAALTVFAGGATDPGIMDLADEEIRALVLDELDRSLGLSGDPVVEDLRRWPRAIPQCEVGHGRFVELAAGLERDVPGLALAGSYLSGPSVPDCIDLARRKAEELLAGH
jgi:oxygen-dependent protoporphyrinogen oxidase